MAITFSWVPRNKTVQADVLVSHFEPGVAAPEGWQVVVECRYRADPGDPWGAPNIQVITPPLFGCDYTPPADGWVQATIYSIENGLASWDPPFQREYYVIAGSPYTPGNRITDAGDDRITDAVNTRITE